MRKRRWVISVSELALILHFKESQNLLIMFCFPKLDWLLRALNSQLVNAWDTAASCLRPNTWTRVLPASKVNILRSGVLHVGQKSCLSSWWWLQVYQKFPQINALLCFCHNSFTVPVSAMLFQKKQQLSLTWRTHIFMLQSCSGYCIHFTTVQNRTSALKTKPNEANVDCSRCKAEFSPVVQRCMLISTLDSDFHGALLQSESLGQSRSYLVSHLQASVCCFLWAKGWEI